MPGTSWLMTVRRCTPARAGGRREFIGTARRFDSSRVAEEHRRAHQLQHNSVRGMSRRRAGGTVGVRRCSALAVDDSRFGYPYLLATGETRDGDTIHDRQHPELLFGARALVDIRSAAVALFCLTAAGGGAATRSGCVPSPGLGESNRLPRSVPTVCRHAHHVGVSRLAFVAG